MITAKAIVLAAGKGTRIAARDSDLPKVMRAACGRPLLSYVLRALSFLPPADITIVVGYKKEAILQAFGDGYRYAEQSEQLGTGHAARYGLDAIDEDYEGPVLICCGDAPLIRTESFRGILEAHAAEENDCTVLSGTSYGDPAGYGRIVRNPDGSFARSVEYRDCTPEEREITELNAGVYAVDAGVLRAALCALRPDNAQKEYYLPDITAHILKAGGRIGIHRCLKPSEILGVNTAEQLEMVEYIIRDEDLIF